mmetsp:Transcript_23288/g.51142  ORF Transcript_23288/g.51142 Transcript_23288/m.51142 type:complete len:255 (-) Transcript_23288:45-809(-)
MGEGNNWKLIAAAGGAVAVGAVIFFALKADKTPGQALSLKREDKKKAAAISEVTKEQVLAILHEVINSQEQIKTCMKDLTQELVSKSLNLEQTYNRVKQVQPADPLEKNGLSMMDFDQLLDKYQGDPNIRECIKKIMGAPSPNSIATEKVQAIGVEKIIAVHNYMLEELDKLAAEFQTLPNKESFDMKTVTVATQAIVGAKIEDKFGFSAEDIESAVLMYHTMLATNQEFATINIRIQHTMGKLMGNPFDVEAR